MKRKPIENIKLGMFVLSGMLILIFALYMLSKNRSFFQSLIYYHPFQKHQRTSAGQ